MKNSAISLLSAGISVVPCKGKRASIEWKNLQTTRLTPVQATRYFGNPENDLNMATICGKVSGNLECLDFDSPTIYGEWLALVKGSLPSFDPQYQLCVNLTPSKGHHVRYRLHSSVGSSTVYARDEENKVLIESRGEGSYALCPPSKGYDLLHGDLSKLPVVDEALREIFVNCARALNRAYPPGALKEAEGLSSKQVKVSDHDGDNDRPGDFYNETGDVHKLLLSHGWKEMATGRNGSVLYQRPDKEGSGYSASWNYIPDRFYAFTTNSVFDPNKVYTKFGVLATLEYGGDYGAAARGIRLSQMQGISEDKKAIISKKVPENFPADDGSDDNGLDDDYYPETKSPKIFDEILGTDGFLSRRFLDLHGSEVLWCEELGSWFIWDGSRWAFDKTLEIYRLSQNVTQSFLEEASRCDFPSVRKQLIKYASQSDGQSKRTSYLEYSKSAVPSSPEHFDQHHHLLNCENGIVNLRTSELIPPRKSLLLTKQCKASLPDPESEGGRLWDKFLADILPDTEVREFMQRAVGYAATGFSTSHVFIILYGDGDNGKSTFLRIISKVLGDYSQSLENGLLLKKTLESHTTGLAELKGSRFVTASEIDQGKQLNESLVKQLTGGDDIKGRLLYKNNIQFQPTHTIFYAVNHKPEITDSSKGMWRRIRLVPFSLRMTADQRDERLEEKLLKEKDYILRWIVGGAKKWFADGELKTPPKIMAETAEYRDETDHINQFIVNRCVKGEGFCAFSGELRNAYKQWCIEHDEKPVSETAFGRYLRSKGYKKTKGQRVTWHGLKLIEVNEPLEPAPVDEDPSNPDGKSGDTPPTEYAKGDPAGGIWNEESIELTKDGQRQSRFTEVALYEMQVELGYDRILGLPDLTASGLVSYYGGLDREMPDDFWDRLDKKYGVNQETKDQ